VENQWPTHLCHWEVSRRHFGVNQCLVQVLGDVVAGWEPNVMWLKFCSDHESSQSSPSSQTVEMNITHLQPKSQVHINMLQFQLGNSIFPDILRWIFRDFDKYLNLEFIKRIT
jgi:hypothetical protein